MKLVFATHNLNKFAEIKALVPASIDLVSLHEIGCDEAIAETADTIEGNAFLKARYVKENYGYDCFADDTGLEVNALDGAPGVYSARYAGPQKNDADNVEKLLKALENKTDRSAQFKTVIALVMGGREIGFTGICKGEIISERKGDNGFGYDPVFRPNGFNSTFAEMAVAQKGEISHRGKALKKLLAFL